MSEGKSKILKSIDDRIKQFTDKHPELIVPVANLLLSLLDLIKIRQEMSMTVSSSHCIAHIENNQPKEVKGFEIEFLSIHEAAIIISNLADDNDKLQIKEYLHSLIPAVVMGKLEKFLHDELALPASRGGFGIIGLFMNRNKGRYEEDFVLADSQVNKIKLDEAIKKYYEGLGGTIKFGTEIEDSMLYFEATIGAKKIGGMVTNDEDMPVRITLHDRS